MRKMPLSVTHPNPLGKIPGTPTWYQLVARHQGYLLQASLTEVPLGLDAGRQAKKVLL